jgi:hypothetical protein
MARVVFRQSRPADQLRRGESPLSGTIVSACVSGVAVAAAAAWRARVEGRSGWRPINGISHMVWGRRAAVQERVTLRYTGSGLLLNGLACGFWAWLYCLMHPVRPGLLGFVRSAVRAIGVSALAYVTDYHVVPRRFTPGFELTLSRRSFPWVYGALAAGLAVPDWWALVGSRSDT